MKKTVVRVQGARNHDILFLKLWVKTSTRWERGKGTRKETNAWDQITLGQGKKTLGYSTARES